MITNMFSIYDEKCQTYSSPFTQPHIGQAIRSFNDLSQDKTTSINRHPEDYTLYHIGEFDDSSSNLKSFNEPKFLARASEFVGQNIKE